MKLDDSVLTAVARLSASELTPQQWEQMAHSAQIAGELYTAIYAG
jgi:hypothetical protein